MRDSTNRRFDGSSIARNPADEGSKRLLAAAAQGARLDKRLWTGMAGLPGAQGNTTALVGTPEQVAEAMLDDYDLGIGTILIGGFDALADAVAYGRDLLPRVRAMVAERDAARVPEPAHIGNSRHEPATAEEDGAMSEHHSHAEPWKHDGVRVIKGDQFDPNTAQTPGMFRQAAIDHARVGAQRIWAGTVAIQPDAKTGVHHHGALESVIYVVRGRARMRWGERLEYVAEAGPGDFIFVPPYVPHQEINADPDQVLECVLVRSDNEAVVVAISDVEPVEKPEAVYWVDPIHRDPRA